MWGTSGREIISAFAVMEGKVFSEVSSLLSSLSYHQKMPAYFCWFALKKNYILPINIVPSNKSKGIIIIWDLAQHYL